MNSIEYCERVELQDLELKSAWKSMPIVDNDSPLVSLKNVGFNLIFEPSFMENYRYLVRKEIVDKIERISEALEAQEKRLIIRSAWRSFQHQRLIWKNKVKYLAKIHPEKSTREINALVSHFVAQEDQSMHSTGGAVDALIFDLINDFVLDFGTNTGLDIDLNEQCFPYHPDISEAARNNRKLLIDLFEEEDFKCDNKEYWHFDYGNAVWAVKKNLKRAIYGLVGDY